MPRSIIRICFTFCASIALLSSCHVEQAKPIKKKSLIIASDFLEEADTVLFEAFVKKYEVRLIIRSMSTDAVIGLMRNAEYNSGLDMIISESSQSAFRLSKQHIFHSLSDEDPELQFEHDYVSSKYDYVALGIDPYVIHYASDTAITARTYQDLFKMPHYHTLSKDDLLSFMSPLRHEKNQVETFNWVQKWHKLAVKRPKNGPYADSLPAILSRHSHLHEIIDSTGESAVKVIYYPDGLRKGCYFDLLTMGIVKQAENYPTAKLFMAYYSNPGHNSIINKELHTFPLFDYFPSRKEKFHINPVKRETLLQYHGMIDRIINKLE